MAHHKRGEPTPAPTPTATQPVGVDEALRQLLGEVVEETQPQIARPYADLRGRVAIVSGAATGIGRAIALELAEHGCHIAFNYLDDEEGITAADALKTAKELRELEVRVFCRECDVRDRDAVESFVEEAVEELGGVQILVNNAGIGRDRALWRMTDEQWQDVIDTNLTGAFNMIRAVAPALRRQQDGKIVNISSIHATRTEFGVANYAASKAGLIGLTLSAAVELGPSNVNVNAVAPGYIRTTRLTDGVPAELLDRARERSVLGRLGDPRDVAHVVTFLCSEQARHITGAVIPVDGGHLL
ncbi:MAG TPA: 3-oxoacyl-ACP reductase FabG [Longimicrobiales bacterium]